MFFYWHKAEQDSITAVQTNRPREARCSMFPSLAMDEWQCTELRWQDFGTRQLLAEPSGASCQSSAAPAAPVAPPLPELSHGWRLARSARMVGRERNCCPAQRRRRAGGGRRERTAAPCGPGEAVPAVPGRHSGEARGTDTRGSSPGPEPAGGGLWWVRSVWTVGLLKPLENLYRIRLLERTTYSGKESVYGEASWTGCSPPFPSAALEEVEGRRVFFLLAFYFHCSSLLLISSKLK